jgi:hypothetical protein
VRAPRWSDAGRLAAATLLGAAPLAAPLAAQTDACDPAVLEETTGGPGSAAALRAFLATHAEAAGLDVVVDSLARAWRTFPEGTAVPEPLRERFATELSALAAGLRDVFAATGQERVAVAVRRVPWTQFLPTTSASGAGFTLFGTELTPLPAATREIVCTRAVVVWSFSDAVLKNARTVAAARYARFAADWRAYERSSPTQYPWELALNGFVPNHSLSPRRWQFIALHPSAAGEAVWGDSISLRELAVMEWGGVVVSWGDFRHSMGVSGVTALRRNAPAAAGGLLRYGRNLAIGPVTWRDGGKRRWSTVMTLDVYRLILGAPGEVKAAVAAAANRAGAAAADVATRRAP